MFLYPKKSQAAVFLIIAIVIFAGVFVLLAANSGHNENIYDGEIRASGNLFNRAEPIKVFIDNCLDLTSKEAMVTLGKQNGRLYISQGSILPDYEPLQEGIDFAYYGKFKVAFSDEELLPLRKTEGRNSLQEQLEFFIANNLDNCIDFSSFEEQGIKIIQQEKYVNVSINENDVSFHLNYPVTAELPGPKNIIGINSFASKQQINLAEIYSYAQSLFGKSIEELNGLAAAETQQIKISIGKAKNQDYIISIMDSESKIDGSDYIYSFAKRNTNKLETSITGAVVTGMAISNNIPTANAGANRTVEAGELTRLFGSGSDADKDTLAYKWQLIDKPGSSTALLSKDNIPGPTFLPDLPGLYTFRLRTNDGISFSEPSNVGIISRAAPVENTKPVIFAGQNRTVNLNEKIILAGYGVDSNNDPLIYMWNVLSHPGSKTPSLQDQYTQNARLIPETEGDYTLGFVANDGKEDSIEEIITLGASKSISNRPPISDAGYDRFIGIGEKTNLMGDGYDPDKNHLNFLWLFASKPAGSIAPLSSADTPNPSFTPDMEGEYTFNLVVDDSQLESKQSSVRYTAKPPGINTRPFSNAGSSFAAYVNQEFQLQGIGSDANNDAVYYRWSVLQMPQNSGASLSNPDSPWPFFTADATGNYIFGLIVNDGKQDSDLKTVTVNALTQICTQGACDLAKKQWCSGGKFISEGYCDACINNDSSCNACSGNSCDINAKKWCDNGKWKTGTYSQYCSKCSYLDSSCPLCESGSCDLTSKVWCSNGFWTAAEYCNNCGKMDSICNSLPCKENSCDTQNNAVCTNSTWKTADYCAKCGQQDSACSFECAPNFCDISSKKWCINNTWSSDGYCQNCGAKDFSCGTSCQANLCDTSSNKWCSLGEWDSLNYCSKCQDAECLNTCTVGSCDINAKKWCGKGSWASENYCSQCGSKDSSCSSSCQDGVCDISSNKVCANSTWASSNYCSSCSLKDKDCSIGCVEGQCDIKTKQVCSSGKWINSTYCASCSNFDISCKIAQCSSSKDSCCSNKNDTICDSDCKSGEDADCSSSTCNSQGNCTIGENCGKDSECASKFCIENKCTADESCISNSDCESGFCSSNLCKEQDLCSNGIKDELEADIDCSGECKEKCALGNGCSLEGDCETGLACVSNICAQKIADIQEDTTKDSDNDGLPDEWELKYGLNPGDASDASTDLDNDGLQNIREYSLATNPKSADSDNDNVSDKEEIDKGTNPLDAVSKPEGIGGLLFVVIIIIIVFGAGSYLLYYYKDKILGIFGRNAKIEYETQINQMPQEVHDPYMHKPIQKPQPRVDTRKLVEKRRAEKEKGRKEIFKSFNEGPKKQDGEMDFLLVDKDSKRSMSKGNDVFSELKSIAERKKK